MCTMKKGELGNASPNLWEIYLLQLVSFGRVTISHVHTFISASLRSNLLVWPCLRGVMGKFFTCSTNIYAQSPCEVSQGSTIVALVMRLVSGR